MGMLHPAWSETKHTLQRHLAASSRTSSVTDPAFQVIDSLQRLRPDIQVEALFAAAVILANAIGKDPHELVARARRQVDEVLAFETAASTISDYARGELT